MTVNLIAGQSQGLYDPFVTHDEKLFKHGKAWVEAFVTPHVTDVGYTCPKTGTIIGKDKSTRYDDNWLIRIAQHLNKLEGVGNPFLQRLWTLCEATIRAAGEGRSTLTITAQKVTLDVKVWAKDDEDAPAEFVSAEIRVLAQPDAEYQEQFLKTGIQREALKADATIINDEDFGHLYLALRREGQ